MRGGSRLRGGKPLTIEHWQIRKPAVVGDRGLVATQHHLASQAGADVLRRGGNAVDAAVAAGLALGTVEPWMSGIGGGGYMTIHHAAEERVDVVEFGMRAPLTATPEDYPLTPTKNEFAQRTPTRPLGRTDKEFAPQTPTRPLGRTASLFNWPPVERDANVHGPLSIAVPGHVKGMALALERFGSWEWPDIVAPAHALAAAGLPRHWYTTLLVSLMARGLAMYDETRRVYLADGLPPAAEGAPLPLGNLAATYHTLQTQGPETFYRGEVAERVAADLRTAGSRIGMDDLAGYTARVAEPLRFDYRDAQVFVPGHLTAGPTLRQTLDVLRERLRPGGERPDDHAFAVYADALLASYRYRLAHLGEGAPADPGHTSHLCVIDAGGNVVSLTQTILSGFGSRVMLPATGILMNNGMMWFDPRPGGPNSVAPGRRPLSNMCPVIVRQADGSVFAVGACGGRRILAAVVQLVSFLVDYRMSVDEAVHHPRIDVSGTDLVTIMREMPERIATSLSARYANTQVASNGVGGGLFALPQVAKRHADGTMAGGCFVPSPTARVVAA